MAGRHAHAFVHAASLKSFYAQVCDAVVVSVQAVNPVLLRLTHLCGGLLVAVCRVANKGAFEAAAVWVGDGVAAKDLSLSRSCDEGDCC